MSKEVMKLALEALKKCDPALAEELAAWDIDPPLHHVQEASNACGPAIAAIDEALAEQPAQQQEPVAWMWRCKPYCDWPEWSVSLKRPADSGRDGHKRTEGYEDVPLYTSPQPSKPLTQDMVESCPYHGETLRGAFFDGWIKAEAAHGIKGDA